MAEEYEEQFEIEFDAAEKRLQRLCATIVELAEAELIEVMVAYKEHVFHRWQAELDPKERDKLWCSVNAVDEFLYFIVDRSKQGNK